MEALELTLEDLQIGDKISFARRANDSVFSGVIEKIIPLHQPNFLESAFFNYGKPWTGMVVKYELDYKNTWDENSRVLIYYHLSFGHTWGEPVIYSHTKGQS